MRVVHVVTAFPRHAADPITPWLVRLLGHLRERGVDARALAPSYRGDAATEIDGIPVRRFRYGPARWETLSHDQTVPDRLRGSPLHAALLPGYLFGGLRAAWSMGRERPDVVHIHWPMPHALFGAAARTASGGTAAVVCSYYSVELNWVERELAWLRPFLRWTIRTADAVTAISSATARRIRSHVDRPIRVVPFAAAVEAGTEDGASTAKPPLAGEEIELLFVGRLVERKGVQILMRALPRILERRSVHLTVVGEGSWLERLRAEATACGVADRVRFAGFIPEAELRRHYASCDIFVLPAVVDAKGDTEGLGVVLLEALRFGRPIVASDIGGIPDIVRPGRSGWLVPSGDSEALAKQILAIASDPVAARKVAARGQEWAEQRFSWERVVSELLEVYGEAVAARRGKGG